MFGALLPVLVAGFASDVYEVRRGGAYGIDWTRKNFYRLSREELAAEIAKDKDLAELMVTFGEESLGELAERIDSVLKNYLRNIFVPGNPIDFEQFSQLFLAIKYRDPMSMKFGPYPLPDEDLRKIKTPTLLLMGDHEILYLGGPDQAIKRAEELVENIQTVLIPNANHMVLWEQTELVNSHILDFLSEDT